MDVSNSRLYFAIGTLGFERQQLERMKETAPTLKIYTVSDGIPLLVAKHEGHSDSADPHIWMSPKNVVQMARNVCNALCKNDPKHTEVYKKKLAELERHADETDRRIRLMVSKVRYRNFLIYHPALAYFASEYGFRQLTIEQDGKEHRAIISLRSSRKPKRPKSTSYSCRASSRGAPSSPFQKPPAPALSSSIPWLIVGTMKPLRSQKP